MKMVGSSVMQRVMVGREFGNSISEVIHNKKSGYDAVNKNSTMYQEAVTEGYKNKPQEKQWKKAYQIAAGLISGDIGFGNTQFYFTPKEIRNLIAKNKERAAAGEAPAFDFSKTQEIGEIQGTKEKFKLLRYKN